MDTGLPGWRKNSDLCVHIHNICNSCCQRLHVCASVQALAAGDAVGEEFKVKSIRQKQEGGVPPERIAELVLFLSSPQSDGLSGRLISLLWDNWQEIPEHLKEVMSSDVFTMRRIIPSDRGYEW